MYWLEEQWNKPSRTDHYLMRIAQRVQQQWSKKPVNLSDQLVKFARKTRREKPVDKAAQIARSKSIWMSRLGIKKGPGNGS